MNMESMLTNDNFILSQNLLSNAGVSLSSSTSKFTAAAVVAFILLFLFTFPTRDYLVLVLSWIEGMGKHWTGAVAFVIVYIATTLFLVPGVILTIFAGYVYGLWLGTALSWIGSTGGALCCFLSGRKVLKGTLSSIASNYPILEALNNILENEDGFKLVLLLRLSPITPYAILNYLLSTTKIKLWSYAISTMIGLLPGTFMYNYLGTAARGMTDILNQNPSDESQTVRAWIFCISLVLTVFIVVLLGFFSARTLRNELKLMEKGKKGESEEQDGDWSEETDLSLSTSSSDLDSCI